MSAPLCVTDRSQLRLTALVSGRAWAGPRPRVSAAHVVTPGVTDDDDGGGVPQMQTQPGGLVGAGVVEPGVVDGPDVPGDVEDPDPVVLEPRRYGTRPVLVPVEELCPEVVDGPDVPGVVDGPDVPGDVDELEGSLYGMYPVGAVDDEGDAVVVEGSL